MTKTITQLRRIIREEIELIDLGQAAKDLTNEQITALFKVPKLASYLKGEVEYGVKNGSSIETAKRNAVYNSLSVDTEDGETSLSDLDGFAFTYRWNNDLRKWIDIT